MHSGIQRPLGDAAMLFHSGSRSTILDRARRPIHAAPEKVGTEDGTGFFCLESTPFIGVHC
jgi:hypothetical protein